MMANSLVKYVLPLLLLTMSSTTTVAEDRGVFKSKSEAQHELTNREEKRLNGEFKAKFSQSKKTAYKSVNKNPWAAKKERNKHQADKALSMTHSWGSCREYSYKKRGQCYSKGKDAYTCERFYDARVRHCNDKF